MSLLLAAIFGALLLLLVTTLAVYFGLSYLAAEEATDYDEPVTARRSVAIAVGGTTIWGAVHVFFGWIPVIGLLLPPIAWVGVLKHHTDSDWWTATVVSVIAWGPSALAYRGVGILLL